jgi:photosystem II stability/assembly factor-like uncharacterized protein
MNLRIKTQEKKPKTFQYIRKNKLPLLHQFIQKCRDSEKLSELKSEYAHQNFCFLILYRRAFVGTATTSLLHASGLVGVPKFANGNEVISSDWERIDLPVDREIILQDVCFVDEKRGFLVGTRQSLLESEDGGKTWISSEVSATLDESANYRFNSIDFKGNEGWIVGKPSIILHTLDTGKTWERIPLSAKLPGNALKITATGKNCAEIITDQGAIYATSNSGISWQAAVQETVDATLNRTVSSGINGASFFEGYFSNVSRSDDGRYVAVSSRGNFFMTWTPGDTNWTPHNRPSGRRIQNMGWKSGKLWLTTRGGQVLLGKSEESFEDFIPTKLQSRGFGILDLDFTTDYTGYACGGSGSLYKTNDGGTRWNRDKSADDLAGNLYAVKFVNSKSGFVLGNNGILLRYIG